jgi:hypothetical protein
MLQAAVAELPELGAPQYNSVSLHHRIQLHSPSVPYNETITRNLPFYSSCSCARAPLHDNIGAVGAARSVGYVHVCPTSFKRTFDRTS